MPDSRRKITDPSAAVDHIPKALWFFVRSDAVAADEKACMSEIRSVFPNAPLNSLLALPAPGLQLSQPPQSSGYDGVVKRSGVDVKNTLGQCPAKPAKSLPAIKLSSERSASNGRSFLSGSPGTGSNVGQIRNSDVRSNREPIRSGCPKTVLVPGHRVHTRAGGSLHGP